jgi:carboxyl-terminal processing protease
MKYPLAFFLALLWTCTAPTAAAAEVTPLAAPPVKAEVPAPAPEAIPVDELRLLVEIFHKLKSDYVEDLSDKTLIDNAIKGLVSALDPHSSYLDEAAYTELQEGTTGEFGGLGMEVGTEDGLLKVISPIDDTPASRAGVQAGDTIIKLDKTLIRGTSLNEAIKHMRGKVGSPISITLIREGVEKPIEITLIRAVIKIRSVRGRLLEPGFGYVRLSMFQIHTGEDLVKQLTKLKADAKGPLKGLILDLRNNPGGVLGAAVAVADAFLDSGRIVYTEGRAADAKLQFDAAGPDLLAGAPLIVLVNEGSASASEIVAGALQDHQRALIMGRQTFGKGSVQTILPMSNKAAIKITTARYFTPSGRSIQAEGITPDVLIGKVKITDLGAEDGAFLKEAELDRHLANPGKSTAGKPPATPASEDLMSQADRAALAKSDYDVFEALNLLKGMVLLQARTGAAAASGH